jgi:hypothetical protein
MTQDEKMIKIDVQPDANGWRWSIRKGPKGYLVADNTEVSERAAWEGALRCILGSVSALVERSERERDAALAERDALAAELATLRRAPGGGR